MDKEKFQFTTDYQADLLSYTLLDRDGYKALQLYDDSYFTLLEHSAIAFTLKAYYKKKKKIPGLTILKEELVNTFRSREFVSLLTAEDRKSIIDTATELCSKPVRDGDEVLLRCAKWASYVELKDAIENANLLHFESHDALLSKVIKAIDKANPKVEHNGTFLVKDIVERQFKRQDNPSIVPTPFRQINRLTNAGGFSKGSIIVFLDKPKSLKTFTLMNVALGYAKMRKNVFIADLENGQDELSLRLEQSASRLSKKDILSGDNDKSVQKLFSRFKRLGIEIYIKRFPTGITTHDLQAEMDEVYRKTGKRFQTLIVDYAALMGDTLRHNDDTERISQVYLDLSNLGLLNDLDVIYTANHIKREGEKRLSSRYKDIDIAKCMDIVRHVQAIYGLNRNDKEVEDNILRWELVAQRDGVPTGRGVFHIDPTLQRMTEFTLSELKDYNHYSGEPEDGDLQKNMVNGKFKGDYE